MSSPQVLPKLDIPQLTELLEAGLNAFATTRGALAADLESVARGIRDGTIIPNEAFNRAKADTARLSSVRNKYS